MQSLIWDGTVRRVGYLCLLLMKKLRTGNGGISIVRILATSSSLMCSFSECEENLLSSHFFDNMSRLMTKPTKLHVRPAKTQISLVIRPV